MMIISQPGLPVRVANPQGWQPLEINSLLLSTEQLLCYYPAGTLQSTHPDGNDVPSE